MFQDGFQMNDAHMICRSMGFPGAIEFDKAVSPGGDDQPIWIKDMGCTAESSTVYACPKFSRQVHIKSSDFDEILDEMLYVENTCVVVNKTE